MNKYPANWEELKQVVKKRDNYQCQPCKESNPSYIHVHHILPLSRGGNNELANLITICEKCHVERHLNRQATLGERSISFLSWKFESFISKIKTGNSIPDIYYLLRYLGYRSFRPGQKEIIKAAISKKDVLINMLQVEENLFVFTCPPLPFLVLL